MSSAIPKMKVVIINIIALLLAISVTGVAAQTCPYELSNVCSKSSMYRLYTEV